MDSDLPLLGYLVAGASIVGAVILTRFLTLRGVRVGGVPYLHRRRWSILSQALHYSPDRRTAIEVPHSADGRPGYRLEVPSDPYWIGTMNEDASRDDFCVLVGPDAQLRAVVLRPEAALLTPAESALHTVKAFAARGRTLEFAESVQPATMAGEPGVRYTCRLEPDQLLTEWKFIRDGWMFVVGVKRPADDVGSLARAERCLRTWTWTEPPPGTRPGMPWTHDRDGLPLVRNEPTAAPTETDQD